MLGLQEVLIVLITIFCIKKLFTSSINPYHFVVVQAWARAGTFFNFQGYPIFYYESTRFNPDCRSKPILLLLHGYPTSSIDWYAMRKDLGTRFCLIAPDYVGYGLSAKPAEFPYTIAIQANMIQELLSSLRISQYHIMAHDVGVTIAQELLARQVEKNQRQIQSIVFLNGGLFSETHRPFFTMKLLKIPIVGAFIQILTPRSIFGRTFNRVFGPKTKRNQSQLDEITALLFYNAPYDLLQRLQCYIDERQRYRDRWVGALTEAKRRCGTRMRLINGPYDPISGKHMYERYCQVVPEPDARLLPDHIGHYPNMEDPQGTLKYFFEFHDSLIR